MVLTWHADVGSLEVGGEVRRAGFSAHKIGVTDTELTLPSSSTLAVKVSHDIS